MEAVLRSVCGLAGGLGMFLGGMELMSAALRQAAGDRTRRVLGLCAKGPVTGALTGAAATAALQSSSAVTVMAVSFVSAGLMSLTQAIALVFGSNVGATVTGQLLAFRLGAWTGPLLPAGFLLWQLAKSARTRALGQALFGFGLLFAGMDAMAAALAPAAASPRFPGLMEQVADAPVLGVVLGASLTAAMQSSSAAVAMLQNLAAGPGLGLEGALPILIGCNIGTTATALIAAAGQSRDAKRTALAHTLFNLSGAVLFLLLRPAFTGLVLAVTPAGADAARQIANAHTLFNLLCTAAWLPLVPVMEKLVRSLIPDK